jgi:hypothetical protein
LKAWPGYRRQSDQANLFFLNLSSYFTPLIVIKNNNK